MRPRSSSALTPRISASAYSSISETGRRCPSRRESCRNAQVYAAKLQLRKKLYLLHAARQPKLRHARADQIPCTKFQFSCPHAPSLHSVQIIGGKVLAIFGNTKYNKFSNTKFEGTCVYGICRTKPAAGGLPAMRRPGGLSCARGRGVVLRGMRASARAVFAAGTSEIEKKKQVMFVRTLPACVFTTL